MAEVASIVLGNVRHAPSHSSQSQCELHVGSERHQPTVSSRYLPAKHILSRLR